MATVSAPMTEAQFRAALRAWQRDLKRTIQTWIKERECPFAFWTSLRLRSIGTRNLRAMGHLR